MTTTKEPSKRRTVRGVHEQPKGRTRVGGNGPRQLGAAMEDGEMGSGGDGERMDYMVDDHDPLNAQEALAAADALMVQIRKQQEELVVLQRAVERVNGKPQRPLRLQICKTVVYRDRVKVMWRYLRRFAGGEWYRGGSHVARLNFGPGIAFAKLRNDRRTGFVAYLINASVALKQGGAA